MIKTTVARVVMVSLSSDHSAFLQLHLLQLIHSALDFACAVCQRCNRSSPFSFVGSDEDTVTAFASNTTDGYVILHNEQIDTLIDVSTGDARCFADFSHRNGSFNTSVNLLEYSR
ncbi:hypothetical protein Q0C63_05755 [Lacticaseibacillus paracasei]|nr:hypothetical protein [Lacticaseibacillus paracasei]